MMNEVSFISVILLLSKRKIPRQIVCVVGWLVGTALGVTVVYGIYGATKKGGTPFNKAENITYGTLSRFTWGLALAWVIYACNKGYGSKCRIQPNQSSLQDFFHRLGFWERGFQPVHSKLAFNTSTIYSES